MAAIVKILCITLVLGLIVEGTNGACTLSDLKLAQTLTGAKIEGKDEWYVHIANDCICTQLNVKLECGGFKSVEKVDPAILSKSGNECLVNSGVPVDLFSVLTFKYAWDTKFPFAIKSSTISCS